MASWKMPLFAGLSGLAGWNSSVASFDLGEGIEVSSTYAHVFAPYMVAFSPPPHPRAPHPAPWKAASGGTALDIHAEISIPGGSRAGAHFDSWSTIWLITALLRLRISLSIRAPLVSDLSFSAIATAQREPEFFPLELNAGVLSGGYSSGMLALSDDHLSWVKDHWRTAEKLMKTHPRFFRAFVSCDTFRLARDLNDQVVIIWGGLEQLFSRNTGELRFRVAAVIASYLEEVGPKRLETFKQVRKAYDQRSQAAHGGSTDRPEVFNESYRLLRSSLIKMVEDNNVPSVDALENNLLDNALWSVAVSISAEGA